MKIAKSEVVAAKQKRTYNSGPSEQERKSVAELRAVRMQAERQMRQYDRVMAKEAKKLSRDA